MISRAGALMGRKVHALDVPRAKIQSLLSTNGAPDETTAKNASEVDKKKGLWRKTQRI
jgi:hypothetical protein